MVLGYKKFSHVAFNLKFLFWYLSFHELCYNKLVHKKPDTRHPKFKKLLELQGESQETLEISVPSFTVSETQFFLYRFNNFPLQQETFRTTI